ncbi:hypothetical protein F5X96DRAFT_649290 [Biscogniauxia mediterranea]|nr:hypothetical protein F5X96DRAFT_649290 [Biscogniauxia mediterranea]
MSASIYRLSTLRQSSSSALRSVSRRTSTIVPRRSTYPTDAATRRGIASTSGPGWEGSDTPWAITSVAVTIFGLAYILAPSSSSSSSKKHSLHADHKKGKEKKEEMEQSHNESEKEETQPPEEKQEKPEASESSQPEPESEESSSEDKSAAPSPGPTTKHKSSQTGAQVPPPPADNSDLAENQEARKEGHEEYKKTIEDKQTRVASSSSTAPSKKTAAENPREDPQKGEGEGVKKGGPSSSSSG